MKMTIVATKNPNVSKVIAEIIAKVQARKVCMSVLVHCRVS